MVQVGTKDEIAVEVVVEEIIIREDVEEAEALTETGAEDSTTPTSCQGHMSLLILL